MNGNTNSNWVNNLTEDQRQAVAHAKINLENAHIRTEPLRKVAESLDTLTPSAPESVQNGTADQGHYAPAFKGVLNIGDLKSV